MGVEACRPLPQRGRGGVRASLPSPKRSPRSTPRATVVLVVALRRQLLAAGLDAGAETIGWHLEQHHQLRLFAGDDPSHPVRRGAGHAATAVSVRSSYPRFQAEQPNECWQADVTHYRLATGVDAEILCWLDDHSRYAISLTAHLGVTGRTVVDTFTTAVEIHGIPASTLTDDAMVFTTRLSGGRGGRNGLETLLDTLGVIQKNSRPNHPTTCGKVERFHQTLKKWLARPTRPTRHHHRAPRSPRHLPGPLQPPPTTPLPRPHHPRHRLHNPTQSNTDRHPHRPPPRPARPPRHRRQSHTPPRRTHVQDRHRTKPRPNPHPAARPRPRRAHHPRPHRRNPAHPHPRPHPHLPTHRQTPRTTPKTTTTRTPIEGSGVSDVSRHHTVPGGIRTPVHQAVTARATTIPECGAHGAPPPGRLTSGWRSTDRLSEPSAVLSLPSACFQAVIPPLLLPGCGGAAPCGLAAHDGCQFT